MNTKKQTFRPKKHHSNDHDQAMPRKKKGLGQNFLRKQSTVNNMISAVQVTPETTVVEIGCGDGFLTRSILEQTPCKELRCYEIDTEWATYVLERIKDTRLNLKIQNILETHFYEELKNNAPLVILANLPYQITFPILFIFQKNKSLIKEGVVMIQEEVAQKITASRGKGYSPTSLFFQHHFELKLLEKIEPGAFCPPPKVFSRLLYFKPKVAVTQIPDETAFWDFLKACFKSPRQTLKNNVRTSHYELDLIPEEFHKKRAQELSFEQLLELWKIINP